MAGSKEALELELVDKKRERTGIAARLTILVEDANQELVPLHEAKEALDARAKSLRNASDEKLKEMGYSGRQEADKLLRDLEEQARTKRVEHATRKAFWEEEKTTWMEKGQATNRRIKEIEGELANFKEPTPPGA